MRFPAVKRGRGRPKKDRTPRPAQESFEMIAACLTSLDPGKTAWVRAAERQRIAMTKERLRPTTIAVVDFITHRLNRTPGFGYDWHPAATIADELGVAEDSVKRAFREAESTGWIKRRRASQRWHTTLPRMFALTRAEEAGLVGSQEARGTEKSPRGSEKPIQGTGKSEGGPENQNRWSGKPFQGDQKIRSRGTRKAPYNLERESARVPAREGGLSEPSSGPSPEQGPRAFAAAMADGVEADQGDPKFAAWWRAEWASAAGQPLEVAFADETLVETAQRAELVVDSLMRCCGEALAAGDGERAALLAAAIEDIDAQIGQVLQAESLKRTMRADVTLAMQLAAEPATTLPEEDKPC